MYQEVILSKTCSGCSVYYLESIRQDKFTFMHLADAFIESDLQCIQVIHLLSVRVFPGN